ncbi:uncharacterized protein IL334_001593 [Kwoniella shivajii]|uniref:Protein OS-9 homolog n=1 Tax=Kwoniella shivajii TaxID=564305 RepID=A0ABZ1CSB9_9TREE|nr:hypothetical protein IL334_001593 [Kwoniella shivajii]
MSRNLLIYSLALSSLASAPGLALRHGQNQLRDLFAYPKYEIQFMNDLPLSKSDAELYQSSSSSGLMDESDWLDPKGSSKGGGGKRLSDGNKQNDIDRKTSLSLELIPMNFAHPSEPNGAPYPYLCLMPSRNTTSSQTALIDRLDQVEEEEEEIDPVQGWQAMSHLDGKCLFTKQGWFTYSYCHNSHIRQFHATAPQHPHPPGGIIPVEDTKYDAYTLGQVSPGARQRFASGQFEKPGGTGTGTGAGAGAGKVKAGDKSSTNLQKSSNSNPNANANVNSNSASSSSSLTTSSGKGQGQSSRYLVQKWSHGTRCDKTGRPREVEVQIHCSMTTTDMIYMIKELSICRYVVIIHSPYLCDLPGFKRHEDLNEVKSAGIKCRQVIDDQDWIEWEKEQHHHNNQQRINPNDVNDNADGNSGILELPFSKRPTGADNPSEVYTKFDQPIHHFGLKGPEKMFPDPDNIPQKDEEEEGEGEMKIVFEGSDVEDESLRQILKQALEMLGKSAISKKSKSSNQKSVDQPDQQEGEEEEEDDDDHDDEQGEQVIFYSWEEGDDGPILLDADLVLMDEEDGEEKEKSRVELGGKEKNVLEKVVRDFLGQKGRTPNRNDIDDDDQQKSEAKKVRKRKGEL